MAKAKKRPSKHESRRAQLARLVEAVTPFQLVVRDADSGHDTARTTRFQKAAAEPGRSP